jgi:hypothetical protein
MSATLILTVPGDNYDLHVKLFRNFLATLENDPNYPRGRAVVVEGSPEISIHPLIQKSTRL